MPGHASKELYEPLSPSRLSLETDESINAEDAGFLPKGLRSDAQFALTSTRWKMIVAAICFFNIAVFLLSCGLFGSWYYFTHVQLNAAYRRASSYSPLFDVIDLDMKVTKLNGTLFTPKDGSLARNDPNPEDDAIWDEWMLQRAVAVSSAEIRAMGKDPSTAVKLDDEVWGLGDDAYAAEIDLYHQIHCLDTLRRLAYIDYYDDPKNHAHSPKKHLDPSLYTMHINHCVDMLLQTLQCNGNLNLVTLHWMDRQATPFPDFSIERTCSSFDNIEEFRAKKTLDIEKYAAMRKPEGQKSLPAPDMYYEVYAPGVPNPNHINGANPGQDFNL